MQYFPPMAAFLCLISFFEIGHLIENNVQMQVYRIMEELLDLKEDFAELQKDITNVRRGLNQDILEIHQLIENGSKTICHCSRRDGTGDQYELSTPIVHGKFGPSLSNDEVLKKLNMILKGLTNEKATRIDFMKANEAMEDELRQNISYLATKVENVRKNIDNKVSETNANALTFGTKLEDKVSTIERKIKETMSNLNKTLDDLDEHVEKMHLDQEAPKCGNGWIKFNSSCYTFIHLNMSWFAAELFGSHLIRIDDRSEFQFIQNLLYELHKTRLNESAKISHYWTAGNDIIKEGDWVWTPLNVPIRYAAWYVEEPNNWKGQEHCAEIDIDRHFKMNDHNCQMDFFSICEVDRKNG
ncbi:hypothetical protein ACJMK2_039281 [Sinanodonta woodiana]|uniref:C-type lectin domain-containing protein n=1 Tax=Sinanodonta woodiana TaxID=1069815 RepID=A0ABD3WBI5_SINWO